MSGMKVSPTRFRLLVNEFKANSNKTDRYSSFDYCYNYFLRTNPGDLLADIEKSSLVLGFYLASWGMLRGSSFLLQKSAKHYQPTIEYIASLDRNVWNIDIDSYDDRNIKKIVQIYSDIKRYLVPDDSQHMTLVTKTMLGVLGFIPAFDTYFCNSFRELTKGKCGFRAVNEDSLGYLSGFYTLNKATIDGLAKETFTYEFSTGKKTNTRYPRAKIVDMYGFMRGQL